MRAKVRLFIACGAAAVLPALLLADTTAAETDSAAAAHAISLVDILLLGGMAVIFLVVLAVLGYLLRRGVSEQYDGLSAAEKAFEEQMIEQAQRHLPANAATAEPASAPKPVQPAAAPGPAPPPFQPARAVAPAAPEAPAPAATPPESGPLGRFNAPPKDLDELAQRLIKLTVLADREGTLRLPIPPDAPYYRLRKGGLALLLPRLESEAFLAHQSKRFDVIFILTAGGEVVTVSRLAHTLNTLMERPGDFGPGAGMVPGKF